MFQPIKENHQLVDYYTQMQNDLNDENKWSEISSFTQTQSQPIKHTNEINDNFICFINNFNLIPFNSIEKISIQIESYNGQINLQDLFDIDISIYSNNLMDRIILFDKIIINKLVNPNSWFELPNTILLELVKYFFTNKPTRTLKIFSKIKPDIFSKYKFTLIVSYTKKSLIKSTFWYQSYLINDFLDSNNSINIEYN